MLEPNDLDKVKVDSEAVLCQLQRFGPTLAPSRFDILIQEWVNEPYKLYSLGDPNRLFVS
jgi:hypothetical protein